MLLKLDNIKTYYGNIRALKGISIEECAAVSRELENKLDRDKEDFALEVSSPGLDAPFRVREQYDKNIGRMVSVQCKDGSKVLGVLKEAGGDRVLLEVKSPVKGNGNELQELLADDIVSTRLHIQF